MIFLTIVIPCFNESEGIEALVNKCTDFNAYKDIEIIFVNNGSTDNTLERLKTLIPTVTGSKLIHLDSNQGYGGGILRGLNEASGKYIGWTHADLQCNPLDCLIAYEKIVNSEKIFFKGKRFGRPLMDIFFTMGMGFLESLLFRLKLSDINAQPTIFDKNLFLKIKDKAPSDFSLDLYFYVFALKEGYDIIRSPVYFGKRYFGKSSWNNGISSRIKFIKRTLDFSFKLKKRINSDHN